MNKEASGTMGSGCYFYDSPIKALSQANLLGPKIYLIIYQVALGICKEIKIT